MLLRAVVVTQCLCARVSQQVVSVSECACLRACDGARTWNSKNFKKATKHASVSAEQAPLYNGINIAKPRILLPPMNSPAVGAVQISSRRLFIALETHIKL